MPHQLLKPLALSTILAVLTANAYAVAPGFYMGFMAGPATNGGTTQNVQVYPLPTPDNPNPTIAQGNPKSTQFGTSILFGYKFNPYAAFEGGFTYYSGVNYVLPDSSLTPAGGTTVRVRDIHILGKVDYSLQNSFGIFGKAGMAFVYLTTPGGLNPTSYSTVPVPPTATNSNTSYKVINTGQNTYTSKTVPTFAVGGSYDFNQNWVMDLTWTRTFVGGIINTMDFYALGLAYHFVDKYCGQFLCED
jgi:hypothetical protein